MLIESMHFETFTAYPTISRLKKISIAFKMNMPSNSIGELHSIAL